MMNLEAKRRRDREWHFAKKVEAHAILGDKCEACGLTDPDLLALQNFGLKSRDRLAGAAGAYAAVIAGTDMYRLLCFNCSHKAIIYGQDISKWA